MKFNKICLILLIVFLQINSVFAQNLKPYILSATSEEPFSEIIEAIKTDLTNSDLEILGEYAPANDDNRKVFIISSTELKMAVETVGGLTGFAGALRVAVTNENGLNHISYTNPIYWGNAYFRDSYDQVEIHYLSLTEKIKKALKNIGESKDLPFGSKNGKTRKALRKYRYMIGMQRFDDVAELNEFSSFEEAVNTIDSKLANSENLVYALSFPDQQLKLYGIAVSGEKGEERFLPIIDITNPHHTAFLPYELLIVDNKAVMLHGRYRIALSFPDLTMMTFSKIMSTPGDIKKTLKGYTK
jgi:Spy/CpxP family protein refolding chaperone